MNPAASFLTVFFSILMAELGDKTQFATLAFSAEGKISRPLVFLASALALICASGIGVMAGALVSRYLDPRWIARVAGAVFIVIGAITLLRA